MLGRKTAFVRGARGGDSLEQARLDRILTRRSSPSQSGENDLIGNSTQMPKGGDRFETAREIAPGF